MTPQTRDPRSRQASSAIRPRKQPRQKRSQILVSRILTSAKELFEREGYAYVSTNRIAEHANLSIGSLYQYFSNCESIALAIYEEASARASLEMKRKAFEFLSLPLSRSMPLLIATLFDIFEADRFALLQLIDEVPQLRHAAHAVSFDNLIQAATITYVEQHFPQVDRKEIARRVYIVEKSIIGTVRRYLDERPDNLPRTAVIRELAAMTGPYLEQLGQRQQR
jgi:AcrR family transcriptional regulator